MTTTEKYIRDAGQWVKVTRDPKAKTFHFARGYEGDVKAHDCTTWSLKNISTWTEAMQFAQQKIDLHR